LLTIFTIFYNLIEGLISIGFGVAEESKSLVGFGGDSLIEFGSAFLVLWHFGGEPGRGLGYQFALAWIGLCRVPGWKITGLCVMTNLFLCKVQFTVMPGTDFVTPDTDSESKCPRS